MASARAKGQRVTFGDTLNKYGETVASSPLNEAAIIELMKHGQRNCPTSLWDW